jgi:hypothetical protein
MNRVHVLGAVAAVLLIVVVGVFVLRGGGGGGGIEVPRLAAFECMQCQYQFGVPLQHEAWPPLKCPKGCGGEAVSVVMLVPRGGGEPEIVRYERYTRQQIQAMRAYRDQLLSEPDGQERLEHFPPEAWIAAEEGLGGRWVRYPKMEGSPWISPEQMTAHDSPAARYDRELFSQYRIIPVFPKGWPPEENVESLY